MKIKKIVFASSTMDEDDFKSLFHDQKHIPGQQAQKYNRAIIDGMIKNNVEVTVVCAPPVTKKNSSRLITRIKKREIGNLRFTYIPQINIKYIKNLTVLIESFFRTYSQIYRNNTAVVCDVLNASVALGAVYAARVLNKPVVGIVTDVPEMMVTGHTKKQLELIYKIIGLCSHYVFLTEEMSDRLNSTDKPYVIIEAVCRGGNEEANNLKKSSDIEDKVCMYAGLLDEHYGVNRLVEAFITAAVPDSKLVICGDGPYKSKLEQVAKNNKNIVYLGSLFNDEVIKLEKEATLLINPRPTDEEFTKYSFPSKVMEYMSTGTPALITKLRGIPEEYYSYVFSFRKESVQGMAETIKEVLSLNYDELSEKGLLAKQFVLQKKNSKAQVEKILKMLDT